MHSKEYFTPETPLGEFVEELKSAKYYRFGVLTSNVHMAWMRVVSGRLEQSYRYSANVTYNNFIWPYVTLEQGRRVAATARKILATREPYLKEGKSLAYLYNESTMPDDLRQAHAENDRAVMQAYGFNESMPEEEIVKQLFRLYEKVSKSKTVKEVNN